jgi:CBS domain-containing protein
MEQNNYNETILEAVRFHPFFQGVDVRTALSLIELCEVRTYEKQETMLNKEAQRDGLHLILSGIAEVYIKNNHGMQEEVLEVVQKGELIGFSSLADFLGVSKPGKEAATQVEVRAIEQSKALFIPFSVIAKRWDDPNVHDYLLAQVSVRLKDIYASLAEQVQLARDFGERDAFMLRVQDLMTEQVVSVSPQTTVQEAAILMHQERTSSVLVTNHGRLEGIITERDLVERVIASGRSLGSVASEVMTPNPVTITRFSYYYDALSLTLLKGIKHLPVVDGEKLLGVVTLSDLLRKKNENVMKTIQKLEQCTEETIVHVKKAIYDILETLIKDRIPMLKTLEIVTRLYDRLVKRAVELSVDSLGEEVPCAFAFYQMGSAGRGEQFILTDQDHFLVYEKEECKEYFSRLGIQITAMLEKAGYARCLGLMMCSEGNWRGTIEVWQERVRGWMLHATNDHLLLAQNFFSYRFLKGSQPLHERFEEEIRELLKRSKIFLYRMTQIEREHVIPTLDQPIRSLFKLERKQMDMKKEVLFPYHHSLQILSLLHGGLSGTSIDKITFLKEKGVLSDVFATDIKLAVEEVLRLYVTQRWQQQGKSHIEFARLSTREKEELILSLKSIKELQSQVFANFTV